MLNAYSIDNTYFMNVRAIVHLPVQLFCEGTVDLPRVAKLNLLPCIPNFT